MSILEHMLYFLDETFQPSTHPDYAYALNGLQVEGSPEVTHLGAAVDASEQTLKEAGRRGIDFLLVHHGLFWDGMRPLTGPRYRKVASLIGAGISLYSLHLPLDAHPELGNSALLLDRMDLTPAGPFGSFENIKVGWWAKTDLRRSELAGRLEDAVSGEVRVIPGGPEKVARVGAVTGGGASLLGEAAAVGLDALVTGEAPHHAYHEAMELGINLLLGGHYATETFGVKALAGHLAEKYDLPWDFLDHPTGF